MFYATCSDIEIDEFQNYNKALSALFEAEKCVGKELDTEFWDTLRKKQQTIALFLNARDAAKKGQASACDEICAQLLHIDNIDVNYTINV